MDVTRVMENGRAERGLHSCSCDAAQRASASGGAVAATISPLSCGLGKGGRTWPDLGPTPLV